VLSINHLLGFVVHRCVLAGVFATFAWQCFAQSEGATHVAATLSADGAYDAIEINGLVLSLSDVETLMAAGVLRMDPVSNRFSFGTAIVSERQMAAALRELHLAKPRSALGLYRSAKTVLPNSASHELTIPSGFGPARFANQPSGATLSASFGGVSRVPYTKDPDGALGFGFGFGNAFDGVGASVMMSLNDLSQIGNPDRISWGIALGHYISDGLSVALGGENLFVKTTDGQASIYGVGSWAFDPATSAIPFKGTVTIGAGSGRFATMTERDRAEGRSDDATIIFGGLAWEMNPALNVIAEWNGRNLNAGLAYVVPNTGVSMKIGVKDLTRFSGDGPMLAGSVGVTLLRF
jgi:hypothetical protein